MHGNIGLAPSAADLAARADFRLGATRVSPATRALHGPGGMATVEPRVMQVLLTLADAAGGVVTRDDLLKLCWGGQIVGDDALNRAVAEVRRVARSVAAGDFGVETIPKTGYRLTGNDQPVADVIPAVEAPPLDRRLLIGGGIVALAVASTTAWRARPDPRVARAAALVAQGDQALRDGMPDTLKQGVGFLREAAALTPDDAAVWGRLALAWRASTELAPVATSAAAARATELAAQRALAIDPRQPDARVALALLFPHFGDWWKTERALRGVIADAPENIAAHAGLAMLLMEVGRARESAAVGGWLVEREPLSPLYQFRRVYGLWNLGRLGEADRVADHAVQLWPRHPGPWLARLWSLAFTGRAGVALAQVDDIEGRPVLSPAIFELLRLSMQALDGRDTATVARAVAANLQAATATQTGAVNAIMILSALGALDAAFTAARGYLLRQGPATGRLRQAAGQYLINDQQYRKTMMLFVPVTAPLRADPRFLPMCAAMGMTAYWRAAGVRPDFLK